ncbi:MAG: RAMP superfamily CRISPR-associated protein, partial [Bacteroidales bacterium]
GSGVKLAKDIDFITTRDTVTIVPQAELMKYFESNPDEMQKFIDENYKLDKIKIGDLGKKYQINGENVSSIAEFERNGFGKPYIPGSSIKGAIRTILLRKRFNELSPNEQTNLLRQVNSTKKEWASEPIVKKLLGGSSNENLMRVLEIFDAEFNEVSLEKVLILSLSNEEATAYKWKKMGRDAVNQDDPFQASYIFVEALPIGAKGYSSISLSNFLFNNPEAKQQLKFSEPSLSDFGSFIKTINKYSLEKLNKEKTFFQRLNSSKKLNELIKNIDTLITETNKHQKDEMILRLSWGSGWLGMTGDYLDDNWLSIFRKRYGGRQGMGKPEFKIFPKTRRIVFDKNEPKYLTGWIKIKLNDKPSSKVNEVKNDEQQDPMELLKQKFKVTESKKK